MLHHSVCYNVGRVDDVFIVGFEVDLVDQTFAAEGQEAAAGDERVTPVGEALGWLVYSTTS